MNASDEPRMLATIVHRAALDIYRILKTSSGATTAARATMVAGGRLYARLCRGARDSAPDWPRCLPRHARRRTLVAVVGRGRLGSDLRPDLAGGGGDRSDPAVEGLADLHRRRVNARLRAGDVAAEDRWPRRAAAGIELRRAPRAAAGVAGLRLPLRDRLDRERRPLARRSLQGLARRSQAAPGRARAPVRLRRVPVRRLPHDRPGDAPRRHARVGDGRPTAPAGARRPRPR